MSEVLGGTYAPGATIRFRVVDPMLGSGSSWSLATKGDTNDVYVTHRESGGIVHCSFHHSGLSQYTFTDAALRDGAFPITYQWCASDSVDGKYDKIEEAIEVTYIPVAVDRGRFIRVMASAGDGIGFNSSFSRSESVGPVE